MVEDNEVAQWMQLTCTQLCPAQWYFFIASRAVKVEEYSNAAPAPNLFFHSHLLTSANVCMKQVETTLKPQWALFSKISMRKPWLLHACMMSELYTVDMEWVSDRHIYLVLATSRLNQQWMPALQRFYSVPNTFLQMASCPHIQSAFWLSGAVTTLYFQWWIQKYLLCGAHNAHHHHHHHHQKH